MRSRRNIIVNSTILFVVAAIVEMTLHEFSHFFTAILVQAREISIHHNYVSHSDEGLSLASRVWISAAGPLVSLCIGIVYQFVCSRQEGRNMLFLFNLYMSAFGYIGCFGYLMIAPMSTVGDTGFICDALGFPMWLTIAIGVTGVVALYLAISSLIKYFVEMGSKEVIENKNSRHSFIHSLILIPVLIGIVITTLLNLPVPAFVSLMASLFRPFTFLWPYGNALKKIYPLQHANKDFESLYSLHPILFVFLLVIVMANRLLVLGIYVN